MLILVGLHLDKLAQIALLNETFRPLKGIRIEACSSGCAEFDARQINETVTKI